MMMMVMMMISRREKSKTTGNPKTRQEIKSLESTNRRCQWSPYLYPFVGPHLLYIRYYIMRKWSKDHSIQFNSSQSIVLHEFKDTIIYASFVPSRLSGAVSRVSSL
jgi:ABC-type Fe3+ transport system permease subunit